MSETTFNYIASTDSFLLRVLETRKLSGPARPQSWDTIVGRPEGIFRISKKDNETYFLRGTLQWNDEAFYSFCSADYGVTLPIADLELPLVDFLKLPDMKIRTQSEANWFGLQLTKVSAYREYRGGTEYDFYFDVARGWLYHGKEQRNLKTNGKAIARVFYHEDRITPEKWELRLFPPGATPYLSSSVEVQTFRKEQHPEREFALSQFGLPEPIGAVAPNKRMPTYLWLALAAIVCALIGLVCRTCAKRAKVSSGN